MKAKTLLLAALFFVCAKISYAQINIPSDSIKNFLCHKWGFKAILMGGQRLTNMNESVTYEFLSDNTFKRVSSDGKPEKGTWSYEPEQSFVILKLKKTTLHIPSLTIDELIVSPGDGKDAAKNALGMGTVLKIINDN